MHDDHMGQFEAEMAYVRLKKFAVESFRPLVEEYRNVVSTLSREARSLLVWEDIKGCLNKIRRKVLPHCGSLERFMVLLEEDEDIKMRYGGLDNRPFYFGFVGEQNPNIFFVNSNLSDELLDGFTMFVDGTFKVSFISFWTFFGEFSFDKFS